MAGVAGRLFPGEAGVDQGVPEVVHEVPVGLGARAVPDTLRGDEERAGVALPDFHRLRVSTREVAVEAAWVAALAGSETRTPTAA